MHIPSVVPEADGRPGARVSCEARTESKRHSGVSGSEPSALCGRGARERNGSDASACGGQGRPGRAVRGRAVRGPRGDVRPRTPEPLRRAAPLRAAGRPRAPSFAFARLRAGAGAGRGAARRTAARS